MIYAESKKAYDGCHFILAFTVIKCGSLIDPHSATVTWQSVHLSESYFKMRQILATYICVQVAPFFSVSSLFQIFTTLWEEEYFCTV